MAKQPKKVDDFLKGLSSEQLKAIQDVNKLPAPPTLTLPAGIGASNLPGQAVRKPVFDLKEGEGIRTPEEQRRQDIGEALNLMDEGYMDIRGDETYYDESYNLSDEEDKELDFMLSDVLSRYQGKTYVSTDDDAIKDMNKSFRKYGIIFEGKSGQVIARALNEGKESINVDLQQMFANPFGGEGYFGLAPMGGEPTSEERKAANELRAFIKRNALPPEVGSSSALDQLALSENARKANYDPEDVAKIRDDYEKYNSDIKKLESLKETNLSEEKIKTLYGTADLDGLIELKKKQRDKIAPAYFQIKEEVLDPSDLELEKQIKRTAAIAKKKESEFLAQESEYKQRFESRYGMEFNQENLKNFRPNNQQELDEISSWINEYNIIAKKAVEADELYKQQSTYLSAKHDKAFKQEYVSEFRGAINSIKNSWSRGLAAKELLKLKGEMLFGTLSEDDRMAYSAKISELMSRPELPVGALQYRVYKSMQDGDFDNFLNTITDSPLSFISATTTMAGESLAQMIAISGREMLGAQLGSMIVGAAVGGVASKSVAGAKAGAQVGGRIASSFNATAGNVGANISLETALGMYTALQEKYTAEEVLSGKWIDDPEVMEKAFEHGLKRGIPIAVTELIASGLMSKFKVSSIASAPRRVAASVARASIIEPGTEALGEGIAQVVSGEGFNPIEVVAEGLGGIGMVASNPFGFGKMIYDQVRTDYYTNLAVDMSNSRAFINNSGDNISRIQEWASNMRSTGQITEETERKIVENIADIRQARIALSSLDDTDAQRTKTIEKGTKTKAEDRLADLYAAKRKLERTPALNKPLQQSIQNEIDSIVLNKKVPKEVLNLSPIIGTGPVYKVNGEHVGKRYVEKMINTMPSSVLSKMSIQIENDDAMSKAVAEKIEDDVSFNAAEYGDDKITFVAESKKDLPRRFREKAALNESTGKYEVEVDKSELAKPIEDVSDTDYEAFKQGQLNEGVLESISDSISEGRRLTPRQREIYAANKDVVNTQVGSDYIAVDPKSTYQQAAQEVAKGKTVYAKNKSNGKVYSVSNKVALDMAYKSGARILMSKPIRKVSGEFKRSKYQRKIDSPRTWKSEQEKVAFKNFATRLAARIGVNMTFEDDPYKLYKGYYDPNANSAVINLSYADSETLWHEILGHPIIAAIKESPKYSELYNNLVEEINSTELGREVYRNVESTYNFNNPEDTMEEAIVQLLGMMSDEAFKKKENAKLLSFLKQWLKEMAQWVATALRKDGITIDDFPANATIADIAKILGYTNKKIVLPGYEIQYKTPTGLKTNNYADVQNEIMSIANGSIVSYLPNAISEELQIAEANLANYPENSPEYNDAKSTYFKLTKYAIDKLPSLAGEKEVSINNPFTGESYLRFSFQDNKTYVTNESSDYNLDLGLASGETKEIPFSKFFSIYDSSNRIRDYIHYNKRFSIGKQIVEQWIKNNNVVYNPEEAYSLGYGFQHQVGLYVTVDQVNLLQNMLQLIDYNESVGGEYILSCATMNVDKFKSNMNGASSLNIVLYPQPDDIKWAANEDCYSGTIAEAFKISPKLGEAVESDAIDMNRARALAGVSLSKYPNPSQLSTIVPDIIGAVINQNTDSPVHSNELGIRLRGNNWRVEYGTTTNPDVKEMADKVNRILDEKYGPVTMPNQKSIFASPDADEIYINGNAYEVQEYNEDIPDYGEDNSFYIVKDPKGIDKVNEIERIEAKATEEADKFLKDFKEKHTRWRDLVKIEGPLISLPDIPVGMSGKEAIQFVVSGLNTIIKYSEDVDEKVRIVDARVQLNKMEFKLNDEIEKITGLLEYIRNGSYKGSAKVYRRRVINEQLNLIKKKSRPVPTLYGLSDFQNDGEPTSLEVQIMNEMIDRGYVKIKNTKYKIGLGGSEAKIASDISAIREVAQKYPRILISSSVRMNDIIFLESLRAKKTGNKFQLIGQNALLREDVRAALDKAKKMDESKKKPTEILMETGWQRGVDGLWRYEILDGKFNRPNKLGTYKLPDVYDSPYLYEVYPFLMDVDVTIEGMEENYRGKYSPIEEGIKLSPSQGIETLVHEIQHAIQDREGFAKGASPKMAQGASDRFFQIQKKIVALDEQYNFMDWLYEGNDEEGVSVDELRQRFVEEELGGENYAKDFLDQKREFLNEFPDIKLKDIYSEDEMAFYDDPYSVYYRVAGEVESRNVEDRLGISEDMRRRTLLQQTVRDVAPEYQILLGVGKVRGNVMQTFSQLTEEKLGKRLDIEVVPVIEDDEFADWDSQDKAQELAEKSGINILRGKSLSAYAVNLDGDVTGALWTEVDDNKFSFDIAVDENFRNMGVGEKLLQEAFSQFDFNEDAYEDLSYEVDVTNPIMERMLKRYGFVVDRVVGEHTIMTHPTNKPKKIEPQFRTKEATASNMEWAANSAPSNVVELAKFLNHAFPGVEVFMSADEFNRMRENGELDMVGEVYGMTKDGKIYINPDVHNSESELFNTLIHEFGHIWLNYIKVHNSALYARGIELVKSTKEYKAELAKGKSPDQAADEALAIIIGNRGADVVNPKMKNWLKSLWKYITKYLGPIETMTLDDFINTALSDLLSGKPIPQSSEAFEVTLIPNPQFREDRDIIDIVRDARDRGYTDDAIKRYLQINKYDNDDIKIVLSVLPDVFTGISGGEIGILPTSFSNVEGGVAEGLAMYNRIRDIAYNAYRLRDRTAKDGDEKISIGDRIADLMANALKAEPAYIAASPAMKKQLMVDLLKSSDLTISKGVRKWISKETAAAKNLKAGSKANADLQKKFRAFIMMSLPKTEYSKQEIKSLFTIINGLTDTNKEQIKNEILNKVSEIKSSRLAKDINKLIGKTAITKVESSRIKGATTIEVQDFMNVLKSHLMSADSSKAQIEMKLNELNRLIQDAIIAADYDPALIMALKYNSALIMALKYNSALLMESTDDGRVIALKEVYDDLKAIITAGRVEFREEGREMARRLNKMKSDAVFDASGGVFDVDFNDTKEVAEASRKMDKIKRDKDTKVQWYDKIGKLIDYFFRRKEDINGLVERMSFTVAEFFEGKMKTIITDRIRDARSQQDGLDMYTKMLITFNAERIFGKNWKKILKQNTKNTVRINGIGGILSQNECYYLYNQYKDPANHPGFKSKFGDDYKEIMDEVISYLDPKVKEWADWQVDVFFPTMYPIYNEVYMRIYRTRMPYNSLYAGKLVRESMPGDSDPTFDLFGTSGDIESQSMMYMVGGESTKERKENKRAIVIMDGDVILRQYSRDMNYFATFGEALKDIGRIMTEPLVRKTIEAYSGKENYDALKTLISRLYKSGFGREHADLWVTGMSNFSMAKLGFNPKIYLQQASTFTGYIPFIGYRNYAKWASIEFKDKFLGKKTWAEIIRNSDYLQRRFSDVDIQQLIGGFSSARDADNFSWFPEKWVNYMMYFVKQGDRVGIRGAIPNYLYYKDKYLKQGMAEENAIKAAVKKIEEQTKKIAQSNEIEDKDLMQTGNSFEKAFGLFLSQPAQYLRMEMYAIRNMYRILLQGGAGAKGNFKQNLRAFMTYHFVAPLIFQYIFGSGMPGILSDWDEEDEYDLMWAAVLGNLNAVFVLGDMLVGIKEAIGDKPWADKVTSLPSLMAISDITESLQKYLNSKEESTRQKHLVKLISRIGELTGAPTGVIVRWAYNIDALINNKDETFGESLLRLFNFSEYLVEGPKKKKPSNELESPSLKSESSLEPEKLE